jgi:hypothetical protein
VVGNFLKRSKHSTAEWLAATAQGLTPRGEPTEVIPVRAGETVEVRIHGSANLYTAWMEYAVSPGKNLEYKKKEEPVYKDVDAYKRFTFREGTVVHTESWSGLHGVRPRGHTKRRTYVCAGGATS